MRRKNEHIKVQSQETQQIIYQKDGIVDPARQAMHSQTQSGSYGNCFLVIVTIQILIVFCLLIIRKDITQSVYSRYSFDVKHHCQAKSERDFAIFTTDFDKLNKSNVSLGSYTLARNQIYSILGSVSQEQFNQKSQANLFYQKQMMVQTPFYTEKIEQDKQFCILINNNQHDQILQIPFMQTMRSLKAQDHKSYHCVINTQQEMQYGNLFYFIQSESAFKNKVNFVQGQNFLTMSKKYCLQYQIVILLNIGDIFVGKTALTILNAYYQSHENWAAYGNSIDFYNEVIGRGVQKFAGWQKINMFKTFPQNWFLGYPFTFYAKLLNKTVKQNSVYQSKSFRSHGFDQIDILSYMLLQKAMEKVYYVNKILVIRFYNQHQDYSLGKYDANIFVAQMQSVFNWDQIKCLFCEQN